MVEQLIDALNDDVDSSPDLDVIGWRRHRRWRWRRCWKIRLEKAERRRLLVLRSLQLNLRGYMLMLMNTRCDNVVWCGLTCLFANCVL